MSAIFEPQLTREPSNTTEQTRTRPSEWHPLSSGQRGLWLAYRLHPDLQGDFNITLTMRMQPALDPRKLERALETLIVRHPMLRARFGEIDGEPMQTICDAAVADIRVRVLEVESLDDGRVSACVKADQTHAIDVTAEPPLRATLYRAGDRACVLCLVFDHIAIDGWSIFQLTQELGDLLAGTEAIQATHTPKPSREYVEYTAHERAWLDGKRAGKQLDYWRDTLSKADPTLDLRADRRGAGERESRAAVGIVLPGELTSAVREFSAQQGVTPFVSLLASYAALLHRLAGQEQVSIGSAMPTRGEDWKQTLGNFVNLVVMPSKLTADMTVAELLKNTQSLAYRTLRNKDYPFDALIERLRPERGDRRNPYFRAFYVFQKARHAADMTAILASCEGQASTPWGGFEVEPFGHYLPSGAEGQDLTLETLELPDGLYSSWGYDANRFDRATIERIAQAWVDLLRSMVADAGQLALRLPWLGEDERRRVLGTWNETSQAYAADRCWHELFEAHADRAPDALAVQFEEETLTYAELNARANRLARHLRARGVGPDARVGVAMERGIELVVALLATLKAGGAYLPLDPAYPAERLAYMLRDSAPSVVLTDAKSQAVIAGLSAAVERIDLSAEQVWMNEPSTNLAVDGIGLTPRNLAYVIYTSGSTGAPKGVMNEHRGLSNLVTAQDVFEIEPASRVLQFASPSFDASVWEVVMALGHGASLHLAPRTALLPGRALLATLAQHRITHVTLPPSALALCDDAEVPFVATTVIVAGEAITPSEAHKWSSRVALWNAYGPTETTVCATVHRCLPVAATVPIGRPIANTRIYVLDAHREPVPVGVAGEIFIGGVPVARGYLGRAELTAERFVEDPFGNADDRLYRTGDLGRWTPDGNIEFLGRKDSQVKLRGFRIELGEIEARMSELDGVSEVAVLVREDVSGDRRLVAYYAGARSPSADVLRAHLRAALPEYMLPAAIVQLDAFPVTPNGKLNRAALPAPELTAYVTRGYEAPCGEVEWEIARIWQAVLKHERIGRHDNFFELGGSSLLAITFLERARRVGLRVDVKALFATRTLAELASSVAQGPEVCVVVPPVAIPSGAVRITPEMLPLVTLSQAAIDRIVASVPGGAANIVDIYPLAPLQEGIFFQHRLTARGDHALLPGLLEFETRDSLDTYLRALQSVIDRHDVLRSSIAWEGLDEPVQVLARRVALPIETVAIDADGCSAVEQLRARFDPRHRRLDLDRAPLVRAFVARDDRRDVWLLVIWMHHLIGDRTALGLLLGEAAAISRGEAAQLPEPVPYRNFVAHARLGVDRAEQEQFFRQLLADVEAPPTPFGIAEVGDDVAVIESQRVLERSLTVRVRASARKLGVSTASLMHLAWALVLARVSDRSDVVFGTVLLGRMRSGADAERAVGLFINTLPARVQLAERSVEAAARQLQSHLADLLSHEHASLALAQRCSGVPANTPLLTTLLNYRRLAADSGEVSPRLQLLWGEGRTGYPFSVSVDDGPSDISLIVQSLQSVSPERVGAMLETALSNLLAALEHSPSQAVLAVEVLPESERRRVLVEHNATHAGFPSECCLHELIEAQVARTPEAIAVVTASEQVTYRELNARANRLASHLRGLGVVPDALVGVCIERSVELVVALLATLKAGGAYVPFDAGYPRDRLAQMLEDSAPVVVLAHAPTRSAVAAFASSQRLVDLSADAPDWVEASEANPSAREIGLTSRHLAYVIYTSGSTGVPKGAMNEHRGVVNRLVWMQREYAIGSSDIVLQKTPSSFDVSVWEFFCTLLSGAQLVMARPGGHREPAYLSQRIREAGVTRIHFVPAMLQAFLSDPTARECTGLRDVFCSGEALPTALAQRFHEQLPHVALHNLYGPTEAAVDVTACTYANDAELATVPIGRPIANTQLYVLDSRLQPVPAGVTGELYIGGVQVGRGYLNRPQLTAARFIDDPFSTGGRLYKTGDLGRWLPDGRIEYLGRSDFQVKLRGFRIELGEIEAQLSKLAGVSEVVVSAREDEPGDKRLVAYYVGTPDADVLRAHAITALPESMVPAAYVQLAAMPLSANGKLDRKALPRPDGAAYVSREYEEPQSEVERTLASIWSDVLKRERVGRRDDFFELGGHSLSAVTLIERMRVRGLHLDVRALFTCPKLADLALAVRGESPAVVVPENQIPDGATRITPEMLPLVTLSQTAIDAIVARVPGGAANVSDIYPLTPLQEGILFHHLLEQDGDTYLTPALVSFGTREALDAFLATLQVIVDRHDILRTSVAWEGLNEPVQVVQRQVAIPFAVVECPPEAGEVIDQLKARYDPRRYRIDVRSAPLLRSFGAHDQARDRWVLLLLLHHLIDDQTSLKLMVEEAQRIAAGDAAQLRPSVPFRNFVATARLGVSRAEHERFFRDLLGDVEEPTDAFGLSHTHATQRAVREARRLLGAPLSRQIREQAQAFGVSTASILHLAWALVLARVSGRTDVVFGTVLSGRTQAGAGAERALGMFINTLPARIRLSDRSLVQSLRETQSLLADLMRHEHAPLTLAQSCSGLAAQLPVFSTLFNYRRWTGEPHAPEAIEVLWVHERTTYPLGVSVDDLGDDFAVIAQIVDSHSPESVCEMLAACLGQLVAALRQKPQSAALDVEVLPESERRRVLVEWNAHASLNDDQHDRCFHELFESCVASNPDRIAVVWDDTTLTYRELNARANRFARQLRELGVGPDQRVALCLGRGVELVIAILATLKAGGAFVPLDPAYPVDRLNYMLRDSEPLVLVVDRTARSIQLDAAGVARLDLERDAAAWSYRSASDLDVKDLGLAPHHLAYVIYTSGSTGRPKGVMNEHRGLTNLVTAQAAMFGVEAASRVLQFASPSFDASVSEIGMALSCGASLHLAEPSELMPGRALLETLAQHRITHVTLPPSALAICDEAELPFTARTLIVAGEAMPAAEANKWASRLRLFNAYGPTEATVCATMHRCLPGSDVVPIGRPIRNAAVYVLNARQQPVPPGVAGEIYIGGEGVARGYLNRPELTAERFLPDPFAGKAAARMYRTGDLGRWLADGTLEYLGRNDFQVKLRGFRIELGEIEARLSAVTGVSALVACAREDAPGHKRLVVYYAGANAPEPAALRAQAALTLPEYMVPTAYVRLERFALTPNGKIDRKALPKPELDAYASQTYEAPEGELEQALSRIWVDLLRHERVGRHDDFFELGGHSLIAIQLVSRIQRELGVDLALREVFSHRTLAELASAVEQVRESLTEASRSSLVPLRARGKLAPLFGVHPLGGTVEYLRLLAAKLDSRLPIYGLEASGWGVAESPADSMSGLVSRYLSAVRATQAKGPYRLIGYSAGGLIAYAMAEALIRHGEEVEFLGIIDSRADLGTAPELVAAVREADRIEAARGSAAADAYFLQHTLKDELSAHAREELLLAVDSGDLSSILAVLIRHHAKLAPAALLNDEATARRAIGVMRANQRSLCGYQPQALPFAPTLFVASDSARASQLIGGWEATLQDRLHVEPIGGTHLSMIESPHIDGLARAISRALGLTTSNPQRWSDVRRPA